ncbi:MULTISPECIES: bifunctional 2-polyprenyl-6-hydroxyphenol methylase/3-demethylubiquinol 3-O-methyltransferase UbiG [unclassified Lentimicrobium]|uniref:class I SAM-dependent methyltransferase n=1 Tax=unclassified Lentimicrobium TaxID=2677434 RepID=UPI0015556B63|nr:MULTISPECIES: hypothetical protein [unclassified Lentimicrobium]NPD45567.1 hypothetical protein [Lentimicrobium sp. S6]NPD83646.1 hypothetical protein [Lentimicrobium sp. L6]
MIQLNRQQEFYRLSERLNIEVPKDYYWYHTIDLGNGLLTPGVFDLRNKLPFYNFPNSMEGLTVLDVGAATGFFSFEFAKRGADVTATELPSLLELDVFPGQDIKDVVNKGIKYSKGYSYEEPKALNHELFYNLMLKEPFEFCSQRLNIPIKRRFVNVYDFSFEKLGKASFDFVFIGDVLLHTINPLQALASIVEFCSGTLVIAQYMPNSNENRAIMNYVGGDSMEDDMSVWWRPNASWFFQVLKKLGFSKVEVVNEFSDAYIPNGVEEVKSVIYAVR